jgi:PPOX class probable F420-dependent enzyme
MRGSQHAVDWAATSTVRLETRRKDGTWVPTAVSLVAERSHLYFRTYDAAGKAKRLRNFPDVRVAPATLRGRPLGPSVPGRARLLQGEEAEHARTLLARRFPLLHGRLVPWMHRRKGWTTLHYELVLNEG